jgi:hypothetical protein
MNKECLCVTSTNKKCGSQLKVFMQEVRAAEATLTAAHRHKLFRDYRELKKRWTRRGAKSGHTSRGSAACDYAAMPRELLPRLCYVTASCDNSYPYIVKSTDDDVRAIRLVRSKANSTV